jgi:hypothetical protein
MQFYQKSQKYVISKLIFICLTNFSIREILLSIISSNHVFYLKFVIFYINFYIQNLKKSRFQYFLIKYYYGFFFCETHNKLF